MAGMTRQTTFSFTLDPTPERRAALSRHAGAARFAFNQSLRLVLNALLAKKEQPEARVPWRRAVLAETVNTL
jgi:putative transposase